MNSGRLRHGCRVRSILVTANPASVVRGPSHVVNHSVRDLASFGKSGQVHR
jgi:hypothetical protein